MEAAECDFTLGFRALTDSPAPGVEQFTVLSYNEQKFHRAEPALRDWLARYARRIESEPAPARASRMAAANPRLVPRNYLLQLAIDAAERGDLSVLEELLDAISRPYDDQPRFQHLMGKRPEWARQRAGCSMLSCSSYGRCRSPVQRARVRPSISPGSHP
jgi:uncharacterized protein YdiU (UPF0061 family)